MSEAPIFRLPPSSTEPVSGTLADVKKDFNRRILVVEDEIEIGEAYRAILEGQGAKILPLRRSSRQLRLPDSPQAEEPAQAFQLTIVRSSSSAIEAVRKAVAEERPYAMGFFDVRLGKGAQDGVELVRQIREIDPEIYAVFVTAYHERTVEEINQILGKEKADRWDYLNKPFSEGEILQKARNATTYWNLSYEKRQRDLELGWLRQKLLEQEKMASLAVFARGFGHEFGNILMQIMGRADMSLHGKPEQMRPALEMILKASLTASQILERFKRLARGTEQEIEKRPLHLTEPIQESIDLLQHQLDHLGVEVEVIDQLHTSVPGNLFSLVQVFVNLMLNSLQAMAAAPKKPRGGRAIKMRIGRDGEMAEIVYYDQGPGIPEEFIEKLGQPFFTTRPGSGTGLGLAICREIVEREHQGEFRIGNHPLYGAQFTIRLPL